MDIVAQEIARGTKILCLDELHVSDVADALILGQVIPDFYLMHLYCTGMLLLLTVSTKLLRCYAYIFWSL